MKQLKKIIASLIISTMLIGMLPQSLKKANATSINTKVTSAIDISSGSAVSGAFTEDDDYLYYKYKASKSGFVEFTIERSDYLSEENGGWYLYVLSNKMSEYQHIDNETQLNSRRYTVRKGDTFYLKVDNYYNAYAQFNIKANFKAYTYVESENNDFMQSATKLANGKKTIGGLSTSDDVDYYCFTAPNNGSVYFDFMRYQYITSDTYKWEFTIYDSKANILTDTQETTGDYNSGSLIVKKGQKVYLKVNNYSYGYEELYYIKPHFSKLKNIETESNNTLSSADKMKIGTTYYGALSYGRDEEDNFYFKASSSRKYKVTVSYSSSLNGHDGDELYVYDSKKKTIVYKSEIKKSGTVSFKAKRGKKYYIQIKHCNPFFGYWYNVIYKVKVSKA